MWTKVLFSVNMENVLFPSFHGNSSSLPAAAAVVPRIKMVSEVAGDCIFRGITAGYSWARSSVHGNFSSFRGSSKWY